MKYKIPIYICLLVSLQLFCYRLSADPVLKSSSLINIPKAYVKDQGIFDTGINISMVDKKRDDLFMWLDFGIFYFAELGLLRLEQDDEDYILGNMRILVIRESGSIPAMSIGVDSIIDKTVREEDSYERSIYGVVSKSFNLPLVHMIHGHLGIGDGRYRSDDTTLGEYLHGVFFGISKDFYINYMSSNVEIMFELDGVNLNLGLRYIMDSGLSLNLASTRISSDPTEIKHYLSVGFTNQKMIKEINQSSDLVKHAVRIANKALSESEKKDE
ncbi:hypothetical protein GF312_21435 [Candidatus Poribacteria bacterium]|nr:hypothetical protein [Candidatus Poribacteria bacterium]